LAGITVLMVLVRAITIGLGMSAGSRAQKQSLGDLMDWVGPGHLVPGPSAADSDSNLGQVAAICKSCGTSNMQNLCQVAKAVEAIIVVVVNCGLWW
jgi:hypothetical protein